MTSVATAVANVLWVTPVVMHIMMPLLRPGEEVGDVGVVAYWIGIVGSRDTAHW